MVIPPQSELAEQVVICTTTYYDPNQCRNKESSDFQRSRLAQQMIKTATERGYQVLVVDGLSPDQHSSDEILRDLEKAEATVELQHQAGMGPGRRQVIQNAYETGRSILAWTEPEKHSYIPELHKTVEPILRGEAELVVPQRRSLDSYPAAQQYAELLGNLFVQQLTSQYLDLWFGPRTWQRELSSYFLDYESKYGDLWDSLHVPVLQALNEGRKVTSVEIDYVHPAEQKEVEENDPQFTKKRLIQLDNLIPALEKYWRISSLR